MKYGYLKVASAVPKIEIADCHYNTSQIENFMAKAEGLGAEIIVFPELCVTGYSCQDLFQQQLLLEKAEASLLRLMEFSRNLKIVTIIGVPLSHKGRLFNLAAVLQHGKLHGFVPKTYLPNYKEFYEQRWFSSGADIREGETLKFCGQNVPISPRLVFSFSDMKFGIELCEDLWAPNPPSTAHVEHFSTHPIAEALRTAFPQEATDGCATTDVEELAGYGIRACVNGHLVCVGNTKMMDKVGAKWHNCHRVGTIIHVAVDGCYAGHIVISDCLKDDSVVAVAALKRLGVGRLVMLTGDRREVAHDVVGKLALDGYHAELLPADKVACVEQLLAEKPSGKSVAFVGDGINDAPVLKLADVGIAMGGLGSDAAIEAADVVLMDDKPTKIATAVRIARRTIGIARQNVAFAIGVKVAILLLATVGLGTMWMAVFADVGVTVLAVFNAMRALKG